MKIYKSITDLVGHTPLLELSKFSCQYAYGAKIYAKLESRNPCGSAKDRIALAMIEAAEKDGRLTKDSTIIEPTSGNTGIALAAIAVSKGYKCIIVMPDTMSVERRNLLRAYGAEVVLTDGKKGMAAAVQKALELEESIPGAFIPDQFNNTSNPDAHYKTTGPEIWQDTDGDIDVFIAGIGTGGSVSGVGNYLKKQNNEIKIIAVEPESSPLLTKGHAGAHRIQGIGANFIPNTLDRNVIDEIITVRDEDAIDCAKKIVRSEGVLVGISSGAALAAAVNIAAREDYRNKKIVVLLPDSGERYLSTPGFIE